MKSVAWDKVGGRIKRLRQQARLTQKALADPHFTHAYISSIESGRRKPSSRALEHIADQLGTTVSYLLTGRAEGLEAKLRLEIQRARAEIGSGDPRAALERAEALRSESRANDLSFHEGLAEEVVGRALLKLGERREAREAFERADVLLAEHSVEARALAVTGAARCLFQLDAVHHAIHKLEKYLIELEGRDTPDPAAQLEVFSALIGPYFEAGLMDKARHAAREAERLVPRVDDPETLACSYLNVAGVYLAEDRWDDAVRAMAKAEMLFAQIGAATDAAKAAIAQAMANSDKGEWESARLELKRALEILDGVPDPLDRARALIELGRIERLCGEPRKGLEELRAALNLLGVGHGNERGRGLKEEGLCLMALDDAAAEKSLRAALDAYRQANNPVEVGAVLMLLGDLVAERAGRDHDPAADLYREGLRVLTSNTL